MEAGFLEWLVVGIHPEMICDRLIQYSCNLSIHFIEILNHQIFCQDKAQRSLIA